MRRHGAPLVGLATLALLIAACLLAWRGDSPLVPADGGRAGGSEPLFLVLLAAAFGAYVAGAALVRRVGMRTALVVAIAAAIQLAPLGAPLLLSTDAWAYWSYGWIAARSDANPYSDSPVTVPGNPALASMGADWRDTPSVYGPVFTLASEPVALVAGSSRDRAAWIYKGLAATAALAATLLAGRLARRRALAIQLVGWNPLLAVHMAGGGHNDAWVAAFVLAAVALAASRRLQASGALWALAIAVKWVPLVFLALRAAEARATRRPVAHLGFGLAAVGIAIAATVRYGLQWPLAFIPLVGNAGLETSYAFPHRLEQIGVPHAVALGLAVAAFAAGLAWLLRRAGRGSARLGLAGCLILVTTPYLVVWYLGWVVPLAAAEDDDAAIGISLLLCAYLLPQTIPL